MKPALIIAFLSMWFLSSACGKVSYESNAPKYMGIVNSCSSDKHCSEGVSCDKTRSICVSSDSVSGRKLYVKIAPKNRSPEVFEVLFDETGKKNVSLARQRTIKIPVNAIVETTSGDHATVNIKADVLATDLLAVPGGFENVVSTSVPESKSAVLSLLEGRSRYRIRVTPDYDFLPQYAENPPKSFDDISVVWNDDLKQTTLVDTDENILSSLELPLGDFPLRGRVRRGNQAISGLYVEIVDINTGLALSGRSKTGCINGEAEGTVCGDFFLRRSTAKTGADTDTDSDTTIDTESDTETEETFYLRIWDGENPAYPSTLITSKAGVEDTEDGSRVFTLPVQSPPVPFGDADGSGVGVMVVKPQLLSSGRLDYTALENCTVVFESNQMDTDWDTNSETDNDIVETVSFSGTTDSRGNIVGLTDNEMIYLFPRVYQVSIIPPVADIPPDEDYLLQVELFEKTTTPIDNREIQLSFRYRAKVRVTARGKDIPGVIIEAQPVGHGSPYSKSGYSIPQEDGSHLLMLDPGEYRLTARVPIESGFAFAIKNIWLDAGPDLAQKPVDVDLDMIEAPIPVVASVHVESEEADLTGSTVEWYEVLPNTGGSAVLVGRSTVDRDGNATGLLPPLAEADP
jgi:hypothetical protein